MLKLSKYKAKDITGYEGLYAVTDCGKVYAHSRVDKSGRLYKGRWLKPDQGKYLRYTLTKEGVAQRYQAHQLVAKAFISNPLNHSIINHKDENKHNNHVSNLEWCTTQYNNEYSHSKHYKITYKNGEMEVVFNMEKFCRNGGYCRGHLMRVKNGIRKSHKDIIGVEVVNAK